MKTLWADLVNQYALTTQASELFDADGRAFLSVAALQREDLDSDYERAKQKVCEICMCRALARPVPAGQSRQKVVASAKEVVDKLGGTVPLPLQLMLTEATVPQGAPS